MARSSVVALLVASALAACPGAAIAGGTAHAPIAIATDGDFGSCHCVVSGSGSSSDPYVIGPWSITNANGDAVRIDGTQLTKSFVLRNLSVNGNGREGISIANVNPSGSPGIVAQVSGSQTTANNDTWGVQVTNSSHVTLDGVGLNRKGPGVAANGFATANTNRLGGIDLEHSSDITVRGWQMNANGSDAAPDWISLDPSVDYWSGGGMRLFDV